MKGNETQAMLLRDALDQAIANPTASWCWHTLLDRYEGTADAESRSIVRGHVLAWVPGEGVAGFLRATFLAFVTGEPAYAEAAGLLAQRIRPVDLGRSMAFATFEWGRALVRETSHAVFVEHLRRAAVPDVMAQAGAHLRASAGGSLPRRPIDQVRKVALVAPFVGPASHPPTLLALQNAGILQRLGMAVHVFACQELLIPHMPDYLGSNGRVSASAPDLDELRRLIPAGIAMTLADDRFTLQRRWLDMLGAVAAFDPDLVLFVGLSSPFVAPLYDSRPVLGLCIHAVAPMAPVDVWLTADRTLAGTTSLAWAAAFPPAWGHYHPYRIPSRPTGTPMPRAQLSIAAQDLVLVTVGARLGAEIAGEWAAGMTDLLAQGPDIRWLLIGGPGHLPPALAGIEAAQLRLIPHCDDVRALLRCADIYVNPVRLGGGFSVAEAMAEGLPCLALAGSDGGNKLGEHAAPSMAAYFQTLRLLIDDPAARREMGLTLRRLFADTLDLDQSGPSLLAACEATLARFRERATASAQP